MAVTQNPHIGETRKKFATAVFYKWKDTNVMRSLAVDVVQPNSIPQQRVKAKVKATSTTPLKDIGIHKEGFNSRTRNMSPWNAFFQANLTHATEIYDTNKARIVYENLIFSIGTLGITKTFESIGDEENSTIQWSSTLEPFSTNQSVDDWLMMQVVVIRDNEILFATQSICEVERKIGHHTIANPIKLISGDRQLIYANFTNPKKTNSSNTQLILDYTIT